MRRRSGTVALVCLNSGDGDGYQEGEYFLVREGYVFVGGAVRYNGERGIEFNLSEGDLARDVRLAEPSKSPDDTDRTAGPILLYRFEHADALEHKGLFVFPRR